MIRIYYHIYVIDGVETIINEQLALLKKYRKDKYTLAHDFKRKNII